MTLFEQWPVNSPQSLSELCHEYCIKNLEYTICDYDSAIDSFQLKPSVSLPPSVSDDLFHDVPLRRKHLRIFRDPELSLCKHLNLEAIRDLRDEELGWLLEHQPVEIRLSSQLLTTQTVANINAHAHYLNTLVIINSSAMFHRAEFALVNQGELLKCPQLKSFILRGFEVDISSTLRLTLCQLPLLTKLDLSDSQVHVDVLHQGLRDLKHIQILRLQNVMLNEEDVRQSFEIIGELKSLRVLDIAQTQSPYVYSGDVNASLSFLMSCLPLISHLDISGTNLAGVQEPQHHKLSAVLADRYCDSKAKAVPIRGLEGHTLQFLGLLNCPDHACERDDLPAKQVTGDATEEQVLLSIEVYIDTIEFLVHSLNELFNLLKDGHCTCHYRALQGILAAMKQQVTEKRVQISGSASLFYIVKSESRHYLTTQLKRTIINRLLDAIQEHMSDATMLRNACLTLCHFSLPHDVLYCYQRLVELLLKVMLVTYDPHDTFIQCIGVNILNSLACQVDYSEKRLLGELGAIDTMLTLIKSRLQQGVCDEVMLYSWSMMWNVTDETDVNCKRFIDQHGLDLFDKCRKKFPNQEELLRNMMGLMGNVAEVDYLRPYLMDPSLVNIFSGLLESVSDGIEVSYNACGVIANLMSDGPAAWTVSCPSRDQVLNKMVEAIRRWKLSSKRNINYRSFNPILRLLPMYETPQVQYWAVWALCNLTKVNRVKYCPLLEKERGLPLLEAIAADRRAYPVVRQLAQQIVNRCFRTDLNFVESNNMTDEDDNDDSDDNVDDDDDDDER